jgi:FtsP/CotA-like multicopper oxidase with cupredoxin domain
MKFTRAMIGEFVFHCHILGHEDKGMMQKIKVVAD